MRIVLNSNVLLVSIPKRSEFRPIFDALLEKKFELVVSNEILSEYEEIIQRKANKEVATNILEMLINLENVRFQEIHFKRNLIPQDTDDNKFVDTCIASGADYLVTEDVHFKGLDKLTFPKVPVLGINKFMSLILRKT